MADYNVTVSLGGVGATATSGVFNVLDYGASMDGVTDDATAIQAAADAMIAAGSGTLLIPAGDYYVGSTILIDWGEDKASDRSHCVIVSAYGAQIEAPITLDAPIIRFGDAAYQSRNMFLRGGTFRYASYNWDSGADYAACVEFINPLNSGAYDIRALFGYAGVRIIGTNAEGAAYNTFSNVFVTDCLNAFQLVRDGSTSWSNENIFLGGSCNYTSGCPDASAGYAISLLTGGDTGSTSNNNKFLGISLECGMSSNKPGAVYDEYGVYNAYENLRYEGFDDPYFTFGTNSKFAKISGGYIVDVVDAVSTADQLKASVWANNGASFSGGTATVGTITAINKTSSAYPAIVVRNATNTTDEVVAYGDGRLYSRALLLDPRAAPSAPAEGTIYYDATANKLLFYNGSAWETITSST